MPTVIRQSNGLVVTEQATVRVACQYHPNGTVLQADDPTWVGKKCSQVAPAKTMLPPGPNQSLLGTIGGAIGGFITGGPGGAIIGALGGSGILGGGGGSQGPSIPGIGGVGPTTLAQPSNCPAGYVKVGSTCVATSPGAAFPGGQPLTLPTGGTVVQKGGTPMGVGVSPEVRSETRRRCPPKYVLAVDGNCYPKAMVPKAWRLWKPKPRPPVTAGDAKAIRKAASAKRRVQKLGKRVGLHVYTSPRKSAPKQNTRFGGVLKPGAGVTVIDTD